VSGEMLLLLIPVSVLGGLVGAVVLLHTPQATFLHLIPYLMLLATTLFAFGGRISAWVRKRTGTRNVPSWVTAVGIGTLQFVIAAYGGFFGGGIGILMLSALSL